MPVIRAFLGASISAIGGFSHKPCATGRGLARAHVFQRGDADVEHLVYDGGSTDGSAEWLRDYASLGYEAIFGPDGGQTDALAKGFDRIGRPGLSPCAGEHRRDRTGDDLEVEPERPAVDVFEILLNPAVELGFAAAADLPQARHARLHGETAAMPDVVVGHLAGERRAASHKAHSPPADAPKLRELGQRGSGRGSPETR